MCVSSLTWLVAVVAQDAPETSGSTAAEPPESGGADTAATGAGAQPQPVPASRADLARLAAKGGTNAAWATIWAYGWPLIIAVLTRFDRAHAST